MRVNRPEFIIIHHSLTKDGIQVDWKAIKDYHIKERLNGAGFYCLSLDYNGLEIYAIEERTYLEDKIIQLFTKYRRKLYEML